MSQGIPLPTRLSRGNRRNEARGAGRCRFSGKRTLKEENRHTNIQGKKERKKGLCHRRGSKGRCDDSSPGLEDAKEPPGASGVGKGVSVPDIYGIPAGRHGDGLGKQPRGKKWCE